MARPVLAVAEPWSPIVELRQYTLWPGMRDRLIELFDAEFVETQEAVGMKVIGQFRDLDDPDRFVWLRGFPDMDSRRSALTAFYVEGEAWKTHRDAARATMVDTTNALLLRPARPGGGFRGTGPTRAPRGAGAPPESRVVAVVDRLDAPLAADVVERSEQQLGSVLADCGARFLASFVTDFSPNTYPALPVREGENVFVWFAGVADRGACDRLRARLDETPALSGLARRQQILTLAPTARSQLRG